MVKIVVIGFLLSSLGRAASPTKNYFRLAEEVCKTQKPPPKLTPQGKKPQGLCMAYYFGDSTEKPPVKQSFEKAYQCALHSGDGDTDKFLLLGLLAANGERGKRDLDGAISYFCHLHTKHSRSEALSLLAELLERKDSGSKARLDYCDFNPGFLMYCCKKGECGDHDDSN